MRRLPFLRLYSAVAAIDVVLAALGDRKPRRLTKPLLMLLLGAGVARVENAKDVKPLLLTGLGLSGLADTALLAEGEGPFAVGLTSFLAAHCCYLVALARHSRGGVRRRKWVAALYFLAWCVLNLVLLPRTGRLRIPVLVYATALAAMAIAALNTDEPVVALGGAAFLVSDTVLALDTFDAARLPYPEALVMLSYTASQALIATGMVRMSSRQNPARLRP